MANQRSGKTNGPQFIRFFVPIIQALQESGGSSTSSEVTDEVIERLAIPDEEQSVILKSGQSRVYNQVHWARMYLVHGGIIDSSTRGIWTLTEHGNRIEVGRFNPLAFYKEVHQQQVAKRASRTSAATSEDLVDSEEQNGAVDDDGNTDLLEILKRLSPSGFERICQRLLREHGFEKVTVTGKSGDGGIDGIGILQVNKFVSFTVLFQCKRYQGAVSASQVRDFRGAMEGRADKGIIMTTGVFTVDAKKEARRDGAKPIELVDGDGLAELFQSLELGVTRQITYLVDERFFDEYRE